MLNFIKSKKLIVVTFLTAAASISSYFFLMINFNSEMSLEMIVGLLKPMTAFMLCILVLSVLFFFFPESLFKLWLKRIAWWYFIVLFLITASTPIYSSNIFHLGRAETVLNLMILLAVITIPFIFVMRKRVV